MVNAKVSLSPKIAWINLSLNRLVVAALVKVLIHYWHENLQIVRYIFNLTRTLASLTRVLLV